MTHLSRLRRLWWRYVRRYRFEICRRCGGPVGRTTGATYWVADDELWNRVEGGPGGIRCIPCFTTDCQQAGVGIHWRACDGT